MARFAPSSAADLLAALAASFLPGALAGTQLAALIFFLNPDLPFGPGPLAEAILTYGLLLGLTSTAILFPWSGGDRRRAGRVLPWSLAVVLALVALVDFLQASYFAYLVPPGINVRLIKGALWLMLAALICFYTALLHTLQRRAYGWRSQVGLAILVIASVYVMVERREAFRPRQEATPSLAGLEAEDRPTLLLVGLEGATLGAVLPLAEQGHLPFFARLLAEGAHARVASLTPPRRLPLWTTVATGKFPYKHSLVAEVAYSWKAAGAELQLLPAGLGFASWGLLGAEPRPVTARQREAIPLWEILARLQIPTGMIGWPGTSPVSTRPAFAFSEGFFTSGALPGSAQPPELAERGLLFRPSPREAHPILEAQLGGRLPPPLVESVVADLWRRDLTRFLLDQRSDLRALFVLLPGLGEVSARTFGGYAAVQFDGSREPEAVAAAAVLVSYYRQLDQFLAEIWEKVPPPRLLVVVSAHGYEPAAGWRRLWLEVTGQEALAGRREGSPDGVLILAGDGIRPGVFLSRAELVDLVPSLLYAMGLPIARDLDGQALTSAFDQSFLARHPLTFVPSYEELAAVAREGRPPGTTSGQGGRR